MELMIVVAIIGILAGIAVVSFSGTEKKTKARAEVGAVFAEFKVRQEQYMLENRSYLSTGATDSVVHPAAAPASDGSMTVMNAHTEWTKLKMATGKAAVYCSYVAIAGAAGDTAAGLAVSKFSYTEPAGDWFYLLAECDMDQNAATNSYYFQHSGDSELYFVDQGK